MTERHQCGDSGQNGTEVWGQRPTLTPGPAQVVCNRLGGTAVCSTIQLASGTVWGCLKGQLLFSDSCIKGQCRLWRESPCGAPK